jgi:hypothetical protein
VAFTQNCSSVWLTNYPTTIPASTKIPHWAYLDVSISGTFDPDAAFNVSNAPESSRPPTPSSTGFSATSSTSTSNSPSSHPSHAGAIAGAVVGGIVGLALVAGAVIFYYQKRTTERSPGLVHGYNNTRSASPTIFTRSPPLPVTLPHQQVLRPQKLYDPHDPSTYPPRLRTTNPDPVTPSLTGSSTNAPQNSSRPMMGAMHYTGAPEVYHS